MTFAARRLLFGLLVAGAVAFAASAAVNSLIGAAPAGGYTELAVTDARELGRGSEPGTVVSLTVTNRTDRERTYDWKTTVAADGGSDTPPIAELERGSVTVAAGESAELRVTSSTERGTFTVFSIDGLDQRLTWKVKPAP
jgi:hypothetical protein